MTPFIHSFIAGIYIVPLQGGLGTPRCSQPQHDEPSLKQIFQVSRNWQGCWDQTAKGLSLISWSSGK